MSIAEQVKQLEADRDRLEAHVSILSKAMDQLAGHADRWKARAEAAVKLLEEAKEVVAKAVSLLNKTTVCDTSELELFLSSLEAHHAPPQG